MLRLSEMRLEIEMKCDETLHIENYFVHPVYEAMHENGLKMTQFILQKALDLDSMIVVTDEMTSVPKSVIQNIINAIPEALKSSGYEHKIVEVENFWNIILNK